MRLYSLPFPSVLMRFAAGILLVWAFTLSSALSAQNVQDFSLPSGDETPSTAPSQAPQGPVDERAGVEIAPRVIEREPSAPPPIEIEPVLDTPPESSETEAATSVQPSITATQPEAGSDTSAAPASTSAPAPAAQTAAPAQVTAPADAPDGESVAGPSFDTQILPGTSADGLPQANVPIQGSQSAPTDSDWLSLASTYQTYLLIGLALLIAFVAFIFVRKRSGAGEPTFAFESDAEEPLNRAAETSPNETSAVEPSPLPPAAPPPIVPSEPAHIDATVEIISAMRSVMMFTIELRVEIANRSDRAIRDMQVTGSMAFAQAGSSSGAPEGGGDTLGAVDRIGPRQSRGITAQLTQPLSQLKTIRQGTKTLFIPLIHLSFDGDGIDVQSQSYVIGSPSTANAARVHPLMLDGPPGGIPGLRAQIIRDQSAAA